jgi:hypothetical protein
MFRWLRLLEACTQAGRHCLILRIHDQRRTAISPWFKAGINPDGLSVHAGQTSVAFTLDRYGHLYPDNGDEL